RRIAELAADLVSVDRAGAFNQAMMELGATICTPISPACERCPVEGLCLARAAGEEREIPLSRKRAAVRTVRVAFALIEAKGRVLLVRRKSGELLGGLWSLPGGEIPLERPEQEFVRRLVKEQTGVAVKIRSRWAPIDRTFSHRKWSGSIYLGAPRKLRSEEHTSELQSRGHLVCRLLLEKKKAREIENNLVPMQRNGKQGRESGCPQKNRSVHGT